MSEMDFICEIVCCIGCGLLFDVNNVLVLLVNNCFKLFMYLYDFLFDLVEEIYFVGYVEDEDEDGVCFLIDVYDCLVDDEVWYFYNIVISQIGLLLMLIEWDNDVFDWLVLCCEVQVVDVIFVCYVMIYLMGVCYG